MATAMTKTACPNSAWTLCFTAGATSLRVQNVSNVPMLVRIGGSVAISDALTAAADILQPYESRPYTLVASDKILGCPIGLIDGALNVFG